MSLLPLSPFLLAALLSVAVSMPPAAPAGAGAVPAAPLLHRTADQLGWQNYLLDGPGPVFRHPDGPLRG